MRLLKEVEDLQKATVICIGHYYYLMLDGEGWDDLHEIRTDLEAYPTEYYIYFDPEEIEPFFFDLYEVGNELDFDTWEEAETYFNETE